MLVFDTNVLIDLYVGNLLKEAFALPYQPTTSDFIIAEIESPPGRYLLRLGLQERELPGEQIDEIEGLRVLYSGPSTNDLSALVLAKASEAILITGDKDLRIAAGIERVPMHGTLWLLEEIEQYQFAEQLRLANSLTAMLNAGRRLPKDECDRLIRRWNI